MDTKDFDTLGGRLSRAREARELSLLEVAELAGIEHSTLRSWERDRAEPRSNRLTMLAGIYGISPSWLLIGRGLSPSHAIVPTNAEAIASQLHNLKREQQKIEASIETLEENLDEVVPNTLN